MFLYEELNRVTFLRTEMEKLSQADQDSAFVEMYTHLFYSSSSSASQDVNVSADLKRLRKATVTPVDVDQWRISKGCCNNESLEQGKTWILSK